MNRQLINYWIILLLSAGCSSFSAPPEENLPPLPPSTKIEIFGARGQLNAPLYEKYVLGDNSLWRECGTLTKSPTIQINPVETQADIVDEKTLARIRTSLAKLLALKNQPKLPPPDSPFGFSTAGAFEMTVTRGDSVQKFTTSVDAVAGASTVELQLMKKIFAGMRSVGQGICGGGTFFGI